jgi:hypothetical protein
MANALDRDRCNVATRTRARRAPLWNVGLGVVLAILGAGAGACAPARTIPVSVDDRGRWVFPQEFGSDPAAQARADARAVIETKRPVRIWIGGARSPDLGQIDEKTGLPWAAAGCSTTPELMTYVDAFNAEILVRRAAGDDVPDFRTKFLELEEASDIVRDHGVALLPGGPAVHSPDGAYEVRIGPAPELNPDVPFYVYARDAKGVEDWAAAVFGPVRITFHHGGGTLIVQSDGDISTYDLAHRTGLHTLVRR